MENTKNIRFLFGWIMGEVGQCVIKAVCEILYEDNLNNNIYNDIYYYTKYVFILFTSYTKVLYNILHNMKYNMFYIIIYIVI